MSAYICLYHLVQDGFCPEAMSLSLITGEQLPAQILRPHLPLQTSFLVSPPTNVAICGLPAAVDTAQIPTDRKGTSSTDFDFSGIRDARAPSLALTCPRPC